MRRIGLLIAALLGFVSLYGGVTHALSAPPADINDVEPKGKAPQAALDSIRVLPGFTTQQVAREPLVKDPIAFDWGADGKLWVVEMGDYPLGVDGQGKPGGVVRYLEDRDGDGQYDKQTTFLDGLGFPNGIMPWRKGVLISCAPDILYAEDRDGDGRADYREVLFTGFVEGNQQHRLNGFELGLDGWVYGANGDSGGTVRSLKTGKRVPISGRDFRFKPDTGELEAESGQTQYGRHRDDWGHWFGNSNPNWAWQYMLSDQELRRNPAYAAPDPRQTLEPDTRLFPLSHTLARFNDPGALNHVTSANSPTPYRDDLFGPAFATSLFVSEPVHNLVHRMVLEPNGAAQRGRRGPNESGSEFVASTDNWFRPTMLKTGPDGALWIADMYRAVIEHPEWIPDDWERRLDLRAGSEEGRIYRVFPVDKKPRPIPRMDGLDTHGLVAALDSPSGWQRDTAQRLLLHRGGTEAFAALRALIAATKSPKTRVQAIWTLADLGGLDESSGQLGLTDPDARVRDSSTAAAATLAGSSAIIADALSRLADDPDARVRFRVAIAAGNWTDRRAGQMLARLAVRDGNDPWFQAAIMSSASPHIETLLLSLLAGEERAGGAVVSAPSSLVEPFLTLAGLLNAGSTLDAVTRAIAAPGGSVNEYVAWQYRAAGNLVDARKRSTEPRDARLEQAFAALFGSARRAIADNHVKLPERLAAAQLLGQGSADVEDRDRLLALLSPHTPIELQQAAVTALARLDDPRLAGMLLLDWKRYSPAIRGAILDTLLSRPAWTDGLLSSLEDTCVPPAELDPARRQQLLMHRERSIRSRAEAVFANHSQARQAVLDAYRSALGLKGDRAAGASRFQKACAGCHRMGSIGAEVGPDLTSLNNKSPDSLIIAILDPNRAFEARYASFTIATNDGRVVNGLISSESATAVTLRRQEGKEEVVLRSQIDEMTASGQSLMPEGLEKDLKPQDLADLFAYIAFPVPGPSRKPE